MAISSSEMIAEIVMIATHFMKSSESSRNGYKICHISERRVNIVFYHKCGEFGHCGARFKTRKI